MSITTYAELLIAASDYLARDDLTEKVPDFVALGEGRLSRMLRTWQMEGASNIGVGTGGSATLPNDYLEWISVQLVNASGPDLRYAEPDSEEWRFRYRPHGPPQMFTIVANTLRIRPFVAATQLNLNYYVAIRALASGTTNWLLARFPDVYLNATLLEAYLFIKDATAAAEYLAKVEKGAAEIAIDGDSGKLARRPSRAAASANRAEARNPATTGAA